MLMSLATITDALRWWGFIAGLFLLQDLACAIVGWWRLRRLEPFMSPLVQHILIGGLCLFLLTVAFMVPMMTRAQGMGYTRPLSQGVFAVGWTCLSAAVWIVEVRHARRRRLTLFLAVLALVACLLASWLTAVHA